MVEQIVINRKLAIDAPEFVPRSLQSAIEPLQPIYGRKVFVGGVPKGVTVDELQANFSQFGDVYVDWPYRTFIESCPPSGYVFIIYTDASSVNSLIEMCALSDNKLMIGITTVNGAKHIVEVKPWDSKNNEHIVIDDWQQFTRYTVFVGGIPRTTTSAELAEIFQDAIGNVAHVCIEVEDKNDYPKGSARVIFATQESYIRAIAIKQITVSSSGMEKHAEIKPYIHGKVKCETCDLYGATSFCPVISCLRYFCDGCWRAKHSKPGMSQHKPMQKGRYLQPTKLLIPINENMRLGMSASQPLWLPASQSQFGSLTPLSSTSNSNFFGDSLRFHHSYGSLGYSSVSAEVSPALSVAETGMSAGTAETIFNFKKH